jgi:hypothetical protein
MTDEKYADLKPISGEARYVEFDEEFEYWAIFGEDSGFCYGQYGSEEEAERNL